MGKQSDMHPSSIHLINHCKKHMNKCTPIQRETMQNLGKNTERGTLSATFSADIQPKSEDIQAFFATLTR
jgi:hypothetical protein